ncbi:MAG: hypothetical protein ACW99H_11670, partial [Candidatus Thorarchaeota archaeon]
MATDDDVKRIPEVPIKHEDGGPISRYRVERYPVKDLPYDTESICPECFLTDDKVHVITATLYEEDGKVLYKKTCEDHGEFIDVYWGDVEMFKKA